MFRLVRLCIVCFLLASCQGKSPKQVSEQYLKAFHNHDYEKAKEYATEDTRKLLDMFISFAALMPDSAKQTPNFEVLGEKLEGDTAYVNYRMEGSNKVESLMLIRLDGKWKVAATKDNLNQIEGGEAMDTGATQSDTTDVGEDEGR